MSGLTRILEEKDVINILSEDGSNSKVGPKFNTRDF